MNDQNKINGFTLIELLVVVAIIGILILIVFVGLNPAKRFQQARDSVRSNDVQEILTAIKLHELDNGGEYITAIENLNDGEVYMMVRGGGMAGGCDDNNDYCDTNVNNDNGCVNIEQLITLGYLSDMPSSPDGQVNWDEGKYSDSEGSGYTLSYNKNTDVITIRACESEATTEIYTSR